ncbi:MAG TPA: hypothetical protein VGX28_10520 [Frankiaceae bacterium]|jgi:hypothetical protein|nr:hypothetical protein [Frankiaceae bacterium]
MPRIPGVPDVVGLIQQQTQALLAVPDAVRAVVDLARDAHRVVLRIDDLLDELEQPLRDLKPGLEKLAQSLERVPETQAQVAAIAATTGRIMAIIDDVGTKVSGFPAAALLSGRRRPKE